MAAVPQRDLPIIAQCLECPIGDFGGVEVLVRALLRGLNKGFRIVLVSNDDTASLEASGLAPLIDHHVPWRPGSVSSGLSKELAETLASRQVALAHFHSGNYAWGNRVPNRSPIVHARRAGIPILTTNHGSFSMLEGYCGSQRPLWMKLALLPVPWLGKVQSVLYAEKEIAVSRNDEAELKRWYWPVRNKFDQIYHSNLEDDEPASPLDNREKTILCVGTIGERKGQIYLTQAFAEIAQQFPDWKLVLAGRNGMPAQMAQIVEIQKRPDLSGRVELVDTLTDQDIAEMMRRSAIFAMPSLLEGLGLSLQEALFRGCACVGSRVGGIPELIEDNVTGLLVEPGSVPNLADALKRLMTDTDLRRRLASRGRPSVVEKGMTAAQMVQHYSELYRSILEKPRRARIG